MILVTAAGGRTGRHVIAALRSRGISVRAFVRREQPELKDIGATEQFVGDMLDRAALRRACEGVAGVIHTGPISTDEAVMGRWVIDAAKAAGVGHFVYHSVMHPQIEWLIQHQQKLRVEQHLLDAGLPYTILQPMHYFQMIDVKRAVETGVYASAYSPEVHLGFVDMKDLAEVSALVAGDQRHYYATYQISAAECCTTEHVARVLSERSGTQVRNQQIPVAEFVARIAGPAPNYLGDMLTRLMTYYNRYSFRGNPNVLTWLLGRPPTTLEQYIDRMLVM